MNSFVLKVSLRYLGPSIICCVPFDLILQRHCYTGTFTLMKLYSDAIASGTKPYHATDAGVHAVCLFVCFFLQIAGKYAR